MVTTNVNCELVQSTRKFTITLPPGVVVQTFFVKNASPPPHISSGGMYQDVHEILGVSAFRSFSEANMIRTTPNGIKFPVSSMYTTVSSTAIVSISPYLASLNTLDAIYLHLNGLDTNNLMSAGFDASVSDTVRMHESSIFARIPFDDSTFTEVHEVVQYSDAGADMFQSMLTRKQLENLDLRVTDARGRSLANAGKDQADEGLMAFHACLRWDLFTAKAENPASHGVKNKCPVHPPEM